MVLTSPRRTGVGHAKGAARGSMQLAPFRGPTSFLSLILLLILATLTLAPRVCFGQTSLQLTESEPTDGFVAYNTAAYFKISLPNPFPDQAERVTINVTPLGDGNPDLYGGWTEFPSASTYDYRSRNWGEDTIMVEKADIGSHTELYLAVLGAYRASNFTIVYQIDQPITLFDGQGQYGYVHKGGLASFDFKAAQKTSLSISVNGRTRVYIGTTYPMTNPVGPEPNWIWSSSYFSGTVNIAGTDSRWPEDGKFYLTVYGLADAYFILSASLNGTATQLVNGNAISAEIVQGDNAYYTYNVGTEGCLLQFSLSAIYGDPDFYVSQTVQKPNPATCPFGEPVCNVSAAYGGETLIFDPAALGDYHIGVNAYTDSSYTMLAQTICPDDSYNSSATILEDGVSQHGALPGGSHRFYSFLAPADAGQDITFSLTARLGDPDMFIRADDIQPSSSSYQWSSMRIGSDTIVVSANDPRACTPGSQCRYFIYVQAYTDCDFYISASTPSEQILLFEGQPLTNALVAGQHQYYAISIFARTLRPNPLVIAVTDFGSGNPNLLVSRTKQPVPEDPSSYQWSSTNFHDDAVNIMPDDPNYCFGQCTYYVAVVAQTSTTYTIVFHMDQPTSLTNGVPQQANVPASAYNFYAFRVNPGYGAVQISLVSRSGYANLFVSNNENVYPVGTNSSTYQNYVPWYTGSNQLITIREDEYGSCTLLPTFPRHCTYVIGVQGFSNCTYTISAVLNGGPDSQSSLLTPGVARPGDIAHDQWQYFRVVVSSSGQTLNVILTATSGDPDLYMSNVTLPNKTPGSFNWSSSHSGGDSITILNTAPGHYYIGVYGWSAQNSTFSVMATLEDPSGPPTPGGIIQLNDGEQQNGVIAGRGYLYYTLQIDEGASQLLIACTKISGDPDLYVRWDPVYPAVLPVSTNSSTYHWRSTSSGDDTIQVTNPQAGLYTIGVNAFLNQASYQISVATGRAFQRLSDGVPRRGSVSMWKYSYFRIFMDSPTDLTISITPFSGDPDLFVSTQYDHPNSTHHDWSSSAFQSDAVTIGRLSEHACSSCYYYVGVYGFFTSTFLITANFGNEQVVLESVPVAGETIAGGTKFYLFDMAAITSSQIDIDVAPSNGLASIYVSMSGEPDITAGHYDFSQGGSFSGTHLTLDSAIACGVETAEFPCKMHIAVHADWSTNYTMLVTSSHSDRNINLINGRSVTGQLAKDASEYYMINVPDSGMDLIVTLVSFTGDADLYMSNDAENGTHPNATNAKWKSRLGSTDTITLHDTPPGPYFIGITGYSACRYSVAGYAYYENSTMVPITLIDGSPTSSVIARGEYRYYSFYLSGKHSDLTISITSQLGDPDVFVTNDGSFPNRTHYQWSSSRFGSDQITIATPSEGHYMIGVFADSTTVFSVVAVTHEGSLELIAGISFGEDLTQGESEYFFTQVTDVTNDLTITVTSLNGDPDLYVSDVTPTPGPSNYTWSATSFRNDSVTIPASRLVPGRYYIAVTAYLNCTFTVLATYAGQTELQSGRPQSDVVLKEQSKYYKLFVAPTTNDITFSLTPRSGYAQVYVGKGVQPEWNKPETYSWSSTNPYSAQLIVIPSTDANACTSSGDDAYCTFFILVRGMTDAYYSITGSSGAGVIDLQEGHPIQSTVTALEYQMFRFIASNPERDLVISISPISGDPDVYVVTHEYDEQMNGISAQGANNTFYQWKSELYGGDTIQILYDDNRFRLGEYSIAVYGASYSQFNLVATSSPRSGNVTTISLVDGLPMGGRIRTAGTYDYYTYQPSDPTSGITFSVNRRTGDPDLFIGMFPTVPTYEDFIWMGSHVGSDLVTLNAADPRACGYGASARDPCIFMIGVRGYTASLYTITVSSTMVTGQLQSGVPIFGQLEASNYAYYSIDVISTLHPTLQVSLTAISGDPDLYMSVIYQRPNMTNAEYHATTFGSEEITVVNPLRTTYYIAVYGWNNCSFSITATYGDPLTLSAGQPYSDVIPTYNGLRFYRIHIETDPTKEPTGLTLALNAAVNGYADIFMQNDGTTASPDQKNGWSSLATSATGGKYIYISPKDTQACWYGLNCTYSVAVRARSYGEFRYTLTYYYGDDVVTLEPSVAFQAQVAKGSYTMFRSMISTSTKDISVSSTQFMGNVSLWAGQDPITEPSRSNYTWYAMESSVLGTHISIPQGDKDRKNDFLYIAVYGESDASFSLLVTTDNVMLVSGAPQSASCGLSNSAQYYFLNFQQPSDSDMSDIIFDIAATHNLVGKRIEGTFDIWISNDLGQPGNTKPNSTNSIWQGKLSDGEDFRIRSFDQFYCTKSCTFYVAVACPSTAYLGGYTITASTSDVLEVLPVNAVSRGKVKASETKYFQVYLATATNFSFVLEPCKGEVDLYISSIYNRPDAKHNNFSLSSHTEPDVFYYSAPPGTSVVNSIFFGVHQSSIPPVDAEFKTRTLYVDQFQTTSPQVPNPILTVMGTQEQGVIQFLFTPAKSLVGTKPEDMKYFLYWTPVSDTAAVLYTECGIERSMADTGNSGLTLTGFDGASNVVGRIENLDDESYKFNLFVYDPSPLSTSGPSAYFVNQAAPNGSGPSNKLQKILIGIGVPAGIILIALVVYLCVKNRKLTQELEVEMHDVPAAALRKAARGAPDVSAVERAQRHHKLLGEEEPDSSDNYVAPSAPTSRLIEEM